MKKSDVEKVRSTTMVKDFWNKQAKTLKESELATAPDSHYRTLEIKSILKYLKKNASVLDVGCGNGFSTLHFARSLPSSTFVGIDYSEEMIRHANSALQKEKLKKGQVTFTVANLLSLSKTPELEGRKFDCIISERCLINLASWEEQKRALMEMKKMLKKGGRIILTENTQEGLARLNELRKKFDLEQISVRWHNYYMPEKKLLAFVKKEFKFEGMENIGNLYYIISRIVYASLAKREGKEPAYMHPINEIASKLPSLGTYQFSPNFIFLLRKK